MNKYIFNIKAKLPMYELLISTKDKYGCWEHLIYGEDKGGSFIFDENRNIIDHEGEFPYVIERQLRQLNFKF